MTDTKKDYTKPGSRADSDHLDQQFHDIVLELAAAIAFAQSDESFGFAIESYGKVVMIARRLIEADAKLAPHRRDYEPAGIAADAADAAKAKPSTS